MRKVSKQGLRNLDTISTYLALQNIKPDMILSSCALRAQITADSIAEAVEYELHINYMKELYLTSSEMAIHVLSTQEEHLESIYFIGHNPVLSELATLLTGSDYIKFPTLGVMALQLDIDSWKEIGNLQDATIEFFIYPNQFKYYVPKHIKTTLYNESSI